MANFPRGRSGESLTAGTPAYRQQDAGWMPNAFAAAQPAGPSNPLINSPISQARFTRFGSGAEAFGTDPDDDAESPVDWAQNAFRKFQDGPAIPRPNLAESFIPVVGPAWEAVADLHDGNYGGAAFNGAMAVADALPVGVAFKGLKVAAKGMKLFERTSMTAKAAQRFYHAKGLAKAGEEVHHVFPLNGIKRDVPNWRNRYPFLKVLPKETHQRLTRRWNGKPRFDPVRRVWYGTTDWMKALPVGLAGYAADSWENLTRPFDGDKPMLRPAPPVNPIAVSQRGAQPNPNLR